MGILTSGKFWVGVITGAVVVPLVLSKVAPGVKSKLPGSS